MKFIFIDTSTHDLTIAISTSDKILSMKTLNNTNEHSKYASITMAKVFEEAGLKPNEIDKVLIINGPGSFTGVRIGVTIAKTYAWALKKDIIPISSLFAYALGYDGYDYYISVLDARRNFVYASIYDKQYNTVLECQYISVSKLEEIVSTLKGSKIVIGDISIGNYSCNPIKVDVLKIIEHCKDGQPVPPHSLNPYYLKRVEAEEKLLGVIE